MQDKNISNAFKSINKNQYLLTRCRNEAVVDSNREAWQKSYVASIPLKIRRFKEEVAYFGDKVRILYKYL
jgi:hypothetical protein